MTRQRGFTLIELLVTIGIIGILIAILLPAVQAARSIARRIQCSNNLRQIGIAITAYHDSLGGYPLTMTSGGGPDGHGGCRTGSFSWMAQILPFIEEEPLYEQIDFNVTMADECDQPLDGRISSDHPNAKAATTRVSVYLCPSDGDVDANDVVMGSADPAPDSYAANAGWPSYATGFNGERPYPGEYNGFITIANMNPAVNVPWHPHRAIQNKNIKDGLSQTAAVSERLIMRGYNLEQIQNADRRLQSFHLSEAPRTLPEMVHAATLNPHSNPVYSAYQGRSWISGWTLTAPTYLHVFTPNTISMHVHGGESTGDLLFTPSSNHPGGVNVLMADGHVIFVADSVDQEVWWAMGSRDDGHPVNLPE